MRHPLLTHCWLGFMQTRIAGCSPTNESGSPKLFTIVLVWHMKDMFLYRFDPSGPFAKMMGSHVSSLSSGRLGYSLSPKKSLHRRSHDTRLVS